IAEKEKNGLKLFFGREIDDIIGRDNNERFEKHEPAYRWIEKLILAGFKIHDGFYQANNHVLDGMRLSMKRNGYLAFQCRSETVLAVICAIS
ncbi:MAG: GRAS family protein, partial [Bacteroidales bacterium]|nr:GRAS family protein [Bacteroidales bacterium]